MVSSVCLTCTGSERRSDLVAASVQPLPTAVHKGIGCINVQTKSENNLFEGKAPGTMGWEGREPSSVFRHSEQLDGRNWFLMVAPGIVLAISKFVYRQSNEEKDVQK